MSLSLLLPYPDGTLKPYTPGPPARFTPPSAPLQSRIAYTAAHVVCNPLADINPTLETAIDWEATLAYRRYLWSLGLAVAEAMDTAQRGMGLTWPTAQELIRRAVAEAKAVGGVIACGAGTDHLAAHPGLTLREVETAYEEQVGYVERVGGRVILMASRALAACARGPEDYLQVYSRILTQAAQPVIIHWLGEMFDPALAGYWGSADHASAMDTALAIIAANPAKVDGVKISLLDEQKEIDMRARLPAGVRMYTGDDFNYAELIEGDGARHSDALLGIFDAIAPAASAALSALAARDARTFHEILAPTVPFSRHIFGAPTRFYKTGVVFLAWLNGHQEHFVMVGGQQSARHIVHLAEAFRLADRAGLLCDPELACRRMRSLLAVHGLGD